MTRVEGPVYVVREPVKEGVLVFPDGGWVWHNPGQGGKGAFDPEESAQFVARFRPGQWFTSKDAAISHARFLARAYLAKLDAEKARVQGMLEDGAGFTLTSGPSFT